MTDSKLRFLTRLCCLLALALTLVACATQEETVSEGAPASNSPGELSQVEKRSYRAALEQLGKGQSTEAEKNLITLSEAHPNRPGLWINLAAAYYKNGKLSDATDALTIAQRIDSGIAEIYNLLGLIAVDQAEYAIAETHYLAALARNNDYSNAHYNLALLYDIFYQKLDEAIMHYERYLVLTESEDSRTAEWVNQLKYALEQDASQ